MYNDLKTPWEDIHRVLDFSCAKIAKFIMDKYPEAVQTIRELPDSNFNICTPSPALYALLKDKKCNNLATKCYTRAIERGNDMEPYLDIDYCLGNIWPMDYDSLPPHEYTAANKMFRSAVERRNLDEMKHNYEIGMELEPVTVPNDTDPAIIEWLRTVKLLVEN